MKSVAGRILNAGLLALALIVTGCGGGDGGGMVDNNNLNRCNENQEIYSIMNEWYYWYDEMPDVDPDDYATPQALLDVLTQPEQDLGKHYSYLTTVAEEEAFLSNAAYVGFGFSMGMDADGRIFLKESFEGSPAHDAGMRRGDEIISVDGVDVASMSTEQFNEALGPDEKGYTVTFGVRHPDGTTDSYAVSKDEVETPVVAHVTTDLGNGDTTYIFFRSFVNPAFDALDDAFAQMKAAGDTQLVLDLRYNGGGLISVAEHLGGLIAGVDHEGKLIAEIDFNDKHQEQNQEFLIQMLANTVDVSDLVVIMTGSTASASEMVINGLAPHMNVKTVGDTSYGKPVGQSRFEFCMTDILRAVAFSVINSEGTSDYYRGFDPYCEANDDVFHPLGSAEEDSISEALYLLDDVANPAQNCSSASAKAQRELAKRKAVQPAGNPLVRDGWDVLTGGAR